MKALILVGIVLLAVWGCRGQDALSLSEWTLSLQREGDHHICSTSMDGDYFAAFEDDRGIRLVQSIRVGRRGERPINHLRSVSIIGASGQYVGQYAPVTKDFRRDIVRGGFHYSERSDYFPVDLSLVDFGDITFMVSILKNGSSSKHESSLRSGYASDFDEAKFDYTVECSGSTR
jgi:hypothetical protein